MRVTTIRGRHGVAILPSLAGVLLSAGCGTIGGGPGSGPAYQPSNVHRAAEQLPPTLKRVAMLPLAVSAPATDADMIRESLEPILHAELGKLTRFEIRLVKPESLQLWTGKPRWTTADPLPPDFFQRLRQETGCDGVLFAQVTTYRAYPPLVLGWQWQLVDVEGPNIWWAVDEVFDAGEPAVANGARRYHLAHATTPRSMTDPGAILNSPRHFGRYTANALVATCPGR
jgi:hypothetical protein